MDITEKLKVAYPGKTALSGIQILFPFDAITPRDRQIKQSEKYGN